MCLFHSKEIWHLMQVFTFTASQNFSAVWIYRWNILSRHFSLASWINFDENCFMKQVFSSFFYKSFCLKFLFRIRRFFCGVCIFRIHSCPTSGRTPSKAAKWSSLCGFFFCSFAQLKVEAINKPNQTKEEIKTCGRWFWNSQSFGHWRFPASPPCHGDAGMREGRRWENTKARWSQRQTRRLPWIFRIHESGTGLS